MAREPVDGHEDLGSGQEFGPWYDFKTEQPFPRLPMDPRAFQRYARRGWMPGIAPSELKAKWDAGEADRKTANAATIARFSKSMEGKELADEFKNNQSATEASADDVADKVIDKLIKLGIIKVPVENEIDQETEATDLTEAGNQLKLL